MKPFSSLEEELYQQKALQNCLPSELTSFVSSQVPVMACLQLICSDISNSYTVYFSNDLQGRMHKHKTSHVIGTYTDDRTMVIKSDKKKTKLSQSEVTQRTWDKLKNRIFGKTQAWLLNSHEAGFSVHLHSNVVDFCGTVSTGKTFR
jgi:hypothetical protein